MTKIRLFLRLFAIPLILLSLGFLVALAVTAGSHLYIESKKWTVRDRSITDITAALKEDGGYATYLIVESYDPISRTLLAYVKSSALDTFVHQKLKLRSDVDIQRRDARIENGVIVGSNPLQLANTAELTPGTHGIAVLNVAEDGSTEVWYMVIGTPFPRP